ncbi:hypothetical protein IFM89_021528 [Coptis chinensis]|uniref:KIB1-4 beta-propeller domain-containing protein n=1 Tax=Coptis chinensis TaxID=261450 RepID=A0A835IPL2_9MAGN|nr:hypothetical protein IFM89_021528 [Coptis chinensis]
MNLPPQSTFDSQFQDPTITRTQLRDFMISKVVLTYPKDPSEDCIAVAIHTLSKKIAIARPGDKTWTTIQNISFVMDVIYFKQQLYGIGANRKLYICDIRSYPPKASEVHVSYSLSFEGVNRYLVEWFGLNDNLTFADNVVLNGDFEEGPLVYTLSTSPTSESPQPRYNSQPMA